MWIRGFTLKICSLRKKVYLGLFFFTMEEKEVKEMGREI